MASLVLIVFVQIASGSSVSVCVCVCIYLIAFLDLNWSSKFLARVEGALKNWLLTMKNKRGKPELRGRCTNGTALICHNQQNSIKLDQTSIKSDLRHVAAAKFWKCPEWFYIVFHQSNTTSLASNLSRITAFTKIKSFMYIEIPPNNPGVRWLSLSSTVQHHYHATSQIFSLHLTVVDIVVIIYNNHCEPKPCFKYY